MLSWDGQCAKLSLNAELLSGLSVNGAKDGPLVLTSVSTHGKIEELSTVTGTILSSKLARIFLKDSV